jgi:hypothetical protein
MIDSMARGRRRNVWISASADLVRDAQRDLNDLNCKARLITSQRELDKVGAMSQDGILFTTYKMLISKKKKGQTRQQQLINWCAGKATDKFDGLIVFDESQFCAF